jgi:hypothetical protein
MPDTLPTRSGPQASNAETIAALAEETGQPPHVVKEVFEREYARLKETARVGDYLILFAARRTKNALVTRS